MFSDVNTLVIRCTDARNTWSLQWLSLSVTTGDERDWSEIPFSKSNMAHCNPLKIFIMKILLVFSLHFYNVMKEMHTLIYPFHHRRPWVASIWRLLTHEYSVLYSVFSVQLFIHYNATVPHRMLHNNLFPSVTLTTRDDVVSIQGQFERCFRGFHLKNVTETCH